MLPQDILKEGGIIVKGVVLCNRCHHKMDGVCHCTPKGNEKCLIKIFWAGKHWEYRRDPDGFILTYERAIAMLEEISLHIRRGAFNPKEYTAAKLQERKFANQIGKWLDEKENLMDIGELSPGTFRDYRGYVNNYFHTLNRYEVREISKEQLSELKDTLSGVSIKTRKNIMNALRSFFYWLKERGAIRDVPSFPEIKGDDAKPRYSIDCELQDEALTRIPERHRDVIEFLMETGLRPGEVCALLVEHFDERQALMRIERTYSGSILRETTKQKKKRVIPLSDRAYEIALHHAEGKHPRAPLFVNERTHKHYIPDTLWRIWKEHSGLSVCLYEATRHSFGSQLIEQTDVVFVKELMGHSSIKTTEKYLHMKRTKLRDVINSRKVYSLRDRQKSTEKAPDFQGIESN